MTHWTLKHPDAALTVISAVLFGILGGLNGGVLGTLVGVLTGVFIMGAILMVGDNDYTRGPQH